MDPASHSVSQVNDDAQKVPSHGRASKVIPFSTWFPYAIAACLMTAAIGEAVRINSLKAHLATSQAEVNRLAESNAMIKLQLRTLESRDAAYQSSKIIVAWDPFMHRGVVATQNLPAPAPGHNYQLWVLDPGALAPISAGLIRPEQASGTFSVKPLSMATPGFAITLEPGAGSPEPTSPILFAVAPGQ